MKIQENRTQNDDTASMRPRPMEQTSRAHPMPLLTIKKRNNVHASFDIQKIRATLLRAAENFEQTIDIEFLTREIIKGISDGVSTQDLEKAAILTTVSLIEKDPAYNYLSARLLLQKIYKEAVGHSTTQVTREKLYRKTFIKNIHRLVDAGIADKRLLTFDLERLSLALNIDRDKQFEYLGIQTLYEKYLLKEKNTRLETPQAFWMRIAMGLCLLEKEKNDRSIEFYEELSSLRFVSSTPTLLHSGLERAQLSSCFLTTVSDDLHHIFKCLGDNAQLSKYSGGVANDWTNIRAVGTEIKTIKMVSQGLVPFLKIANDVTVAISRSGSRRGATVVYLETWHLEIEDFLDLKRNTGDERRRTHDINTATWVPDLFMKRIEEDASWTLFCPSDTPDLHHIYGQEFEKKYAAYEAQAHNGVIKNYKTISAKKLWRKMLSRLFETGHPWITFKDPSNVRSPQDHVGVVHSSNLCTEITLNTSEKETAVCNLGSVNLEKHIVNEKLDREMLAHTVTTAMRMLDNVIDINFYPTQEAQTSNFKHRPVGLGLMGLQDAFFKLNINFDAPEALTFCDNTMELISYHAILGSSQLAKERGAYESFRGSKWDRGIFPLDTLDLLEKERGQKIEVSRTMSLDWKPVREHVKRYGMRNSNTMAIAPTATISTIAGCYPCIEPMYKNIYVKANMSGEFTVVNHFLVDDLKALGLWNQDMLNQMKYYDGNIENIAEIPQILKNKYKEAFDIEPEWLIKLTAARGKWIDQSQSHNVFMKGTSGSKLHTIYMSGWKAGLKTHYYLRTLGASQIEKSTLDASKFGFTQKRVYKEQESAAVPETTAPLSCKIEDPECESCQ